MTDGTGVIGAAPVLVLALLAAAEDKGRSKPKVDYPCATGTERYMDWLGSRGLLTPNASPGEALEPWASDRHPKDAARRHTEDVTAAKQEYRVTHGGMMDGTNCRSPIGGGLGVWDQSWESNRAV